MRNDIRLAFRALRRHPAVALAAILTVGLAVAANTALFSVFDGLLFRPLPFAQADRIVHVEIPTDVRRSLSRDALQDLQAAMAGTDLFDRRFQARSSELLEEGAANVQAWDLRPAAVSTGWFDVFGVVPVAGRIVDPGNATGFLMGEDIWRSRYGGDLSLIGKPIQLPGMIFNRPTVLAGVVPRPFSLPDGANMWFGWGAPLEQNFNHARLAAGASVEQARAAFPGATVTPLREHLRPDGAFALAALLAATGLMLLVAWVQVASLLFARVAGRTKEIGVRLALGASRRQLTRLLVAEGVVIAGVALLVGWALTPALTSGVTALLPESMTRGQLLAPDLRTFMFAVGLSLVGVLVLAVVPVEVVRRSSPISLLRGSSSGRPGVATTRWRTGMLIAQLSVTVVLLYMSGLSVATFTRLTAVDLGFTPDRVLAFLQPPLTTTAGGAQATVEERRAHIARQIQAMSDTYEALRSLPGVVAAAGGRIPFFTPRVASGAFTPFDVRVAGEASPSERVFLNTTTPDYLRVLGLTVVDGRGPTGDDVAPGEAVALVNETLAARLAVRGPVLGQTLTANNRTSRVIGVVKDFVVGRPDQPVEPMMLAVLRNPQAYFVVRLAAGDEGDRAAAAVGVTFDRFWPGRPSRELLDVAVLAEGAIADYRSRATMLVLIGVMCLPLALIGIVGALTYAIEQRRREIGIRLALGALPADIRRVVFRTAATAVGLGLVIGLAGGVVMGRAMSAYLFGVTAVDPATVLGVVVLLAALGWLAAWVPGRRAARIEPAVALREGQ